MMISLDPARATEPSAVAMQWLVLAVAYFTLGLFLIGVFDLLLGLWELITSGTFTDPAAVVGLLNSVLLLLIIVEVHRTLIAYARDEPVVRIVVGAAIIAVAREIIGFRIGEFETITIDGTTRVRPRSNRGWLPGIRTLRSSGIGYGTSGYRVHLGR